jgi:transcriptional regulator with XRE-family HTH domain
MFQLVAPFAPAGDQPQAIEALTKRQGVSLTDVANRSGMDRAAISRLENGVCLNPTVDTLYRYAHAVGADIGFSVRVS